MGLHNKKKGIFVNLSNGKFAIKSGENIEYYDSLSGRILSVSFRMREFKGATYETATFEIADNVDVYLLEMRTDSGYFRSMTNSLKSGDPKKLVNLNAFSKQVDGKSRTGMFVNQGGKTLKHAHTKDNPNGMPLIEYVIFKGKEEMDNTKQIQFFKDWLSSIQFEKDEDDTPTKEFSDDEPPTNHKEESLSVDDLPF